VAANPDTECCSSNGRDALIANLKKYSPLKKDVQVKKQKDYQLIGHGKERHY
jgi:hypothetical protein